MSDSQHCLYFLSCPSCTKSCGAAYGYKFACFYCNNTFPGPILLLRFQAELSDGTGNLTVYVEHREAQMLLGMTDEELVEAAQEGKDFSPNSINENSKIVNFFSKLGHQGMKQEGEYSCEIQS
ncbi:uncharacterized protein LOC142532260 [Primulina tabacum]|uniref:uncharacterized protein LOC142532260 n=1 Tax=Primulina tabacum TaxID=48773 RepID=UPI003F594651